MSTDIQKKYDLIEYDDNKLYYGTPARRKLIYALADFKNADKTIKAICEEINVSYITYFRAKKDPRFSEALQQMILSNTRNDNTLTKLTKSTINFALNNAKCYSDRSFLFKYLGAFIDSKEVNINKKSVNVDVTMQKATTDELKSMIRQMVKDDPTLLEEPDE